MMDVKTLVRALVVKNV